jgi:hypothetical protein
LTSEKAKALVKLRKHVVVGDHSGPKHGHWKPVSKKLIEFCIRNNHSLADLASRLNMTEGAMIRKVRSHFGIGINELRKSMGMPMLLKWNKKPLPEELMTH